MQELNQNLNKDLGKDLDKDSGSNVNVIAQNLLNRFCHALDVSNYDALLACFAPDGTWVRLGKRLTGHSEILHELTGNRPKTLKTIHLVSNVIIDKRTEESAAGQFYMVAYRHDSATPPPYPVPKPTVIGMCPVELTLTRNQWLLKFLQVGPFLFAN